MGSTNTTGNSVNTGSTGNGAPTTFCNGGIRYSTGASQSFSWVSGGSRDVGTASTNTNGNSVNTGSTGNNGASTTFCNGGIRYSTGAAQSFSWVAGGSQEVGTAGTTGTTAVTSEKSFSDAGIVGIVLGCIAFLLFLLLLCCLMKVKKSEK